MRQIRFIATLLFLICLSWPRTGLAHTGMYTAKYVDGANIVLMTDNSHEMTTGIEIMLNFRLYDTTGAPIPFDTMTFDLTKNGSTVASETIEVTANNDIIKDYRFSKPGDYLIRTTFLDNQKEISHGEFPITVTPKKSTGLLSATTLLVFACALVTGASLGAGLMHLHLRTNRLQTPRRRLSLVRKHKKE